MGVNPVWLDHPPSTLSVSWELFLSCCHFPPGAHGIPEAVLSPPGASGVQSTLTSIIPLLLPTPQEQHGGSQASRLLSQTPAPNSGSKRRFPLASPECSPASSSLAPPPARGQAGERRALESFFVCVSLDVTFDTFSSKLLSR